MMIQIDGAAGEGGGQVLRTSLALAMVTGKGVALTGIRAGRKSPGLKRQHLTCVTAAAAISGADVVGAKMHSTALRFVPGEVQAGTYEFAVGSAGSAILVLQTILPPLLVASGPSQIRISGGTHNPMAPPFDFFTRSFLPWVCAMGPQVSITLNRPGFFPAGAGEICVEIDPVDTLAAVDCCARGEFLGVHAEAQVAHLPTKLARRELRCLEQELVEPLASAEVLEFADSASPGNCLAVTAEFAAHRQVFTGIGQRHISAERLAKGVAKAVSRYMASPALADDYLADQLLLPMAMAGGGAFTSTAISLHAETNMAVIRNFLPVQIQLDRRSRLEWRVDISKD